MNRLLVYLIVFSITFFKPFTGINQVISKAEYFVNTDPGVGNGIPINITNGSVINASLNLSVGNLQTGFNQLFIRVKDNNNNWSIAEQKTFYIDNNLHNVLQSLIAAEYFIDVDPGVGKATSIPVQTSDSLDNAVSIPITQLANGFHQLFIRVKDKNSNWSISEQKTFYVNNALHPVQPLIAAEYFVDIDPGIGKGKEINVNKGSTVSTNLNINASGLAGGFHQLFLRVKDSTGDWSVAEQRTFYIDSNSNLIAEPIVAGEYFINVDSGFGQNIPIPIIKSDSVDTSYKYIADNLPFGNYTMNLRVKDSSGKWSIVETRPFSVCSSYGPLSDFQFAVSGYSVSFINNSQYASSYHWNFGNSDTSNLFSPYYTYKPGIYNACLISKNDCLPNGDTLCKTVEVDGLSTINTNHGGNTGTVSVSVTGAGFAPGMQLYLHENGQQDIYGDTLIIENSVLMTTTFDLNGKSVGLWDVIAVFPNGKSDTLHNGFTIEAGTPPNLWVNITGDRVLRIGFNQIYTVTYGNSGNTDGIMVPLLITGLPIGTDIQILNPLFKIDSLSESDSVRAYSDSVLKTINDTANNLSFRLFYLKKIAAGSSTVLKFIFHVPATTQLHSHANIQVILGHPQVTDSSLEAMIHQIQSAASSTDKEKFDFDKFLDCLKDASDIAAEALDLKGWTKCNITFLSTAATLFSKFWASPSPDPVCQTCSDVFDEGGLIFGSFESTSSCIFAAAGTLFPVSKAFKLTQLTVEILNKGLSHGGLLYDCGESYYNILGVIIGNFWDPNSKYGIGDSSSNHYVRNTPLSYVINFENDPAANTNAPTVSILDTLNKTHYDYSSFRFNSVSIGDSIYSFVNPVKSFVHDFDFTKQYSVKARVTGTFDSLSGVAQWSFFSIDTLTNQQTANDLLGFLPPDKTAPKGQGYVSFTVNPDSNIQSGDVICNKASIIFSPNPPIVTNCFTNVFDLVKPVSKVNTLPLKESTDTFAVSWNGSDNLSGIYVYKIYVSINDSAFIPWLDTTSTSAFYPGVYGNKYSFYSIATDNAGNIESPKTSAEAATIIDTSTLAVTLINFNVQCSYNRVLLMWQTATESNSHLFQIQKSINAVNWTQIGIINAAGNSSTVKNYQFTDNGITGTVYYRLLQVDKDGKKYYSNIIKSGCTSGGTKIQAYPVPAKNILHVLIQTNDNYNATILLLDMYGKTIKKIHKDLNAGMNDIVMNISDVASGQYFLKVTYRDGSSTQKIVIAR